jgi:cell division protein FtsZ
LFFIVIGVGGGGGNAINNMIAESLEGVDFVAANTDAQALTMTKASRRIQLGAQVTEGLGAGSLPEVGRAAAEESHRRDHRSPGRHAYVLRHCRHGRRHRHRCCSGRCAGGPQQAGILTVGVVTKPFQFEGSAA